MKPVTNWVFWYGKTSCSHVVADYVLGRRRPLSRQEAGFLRHQEIHGAHIGECSPSP
jgi:hypothetical protein